MIVGTAVPTIIVGTTVSTMIVGTNICFVVVPCSNNHCWNNCFNNDCWDKHLFRGCSVLARFVIGYGGGGTKKVLGVGTSPLG